MNRKIELIQDIEDLNLWHWVILEYDENKNAWFNSNCGVERGFNVAVSEAEKAYYYL